MRRTLLFAVAVLVLAAPIFAESVQTFVGNNTGGPTWDRADRGDPPTTFGSHLAVPYSVQSFKILADSRCYIVGAQNFDGYLHLYQGSFNPTTPLVNIVSGNDDAVMHEGTSYLPNGGSSSFVPAGTLTLSAGTYWLVTSGYSSSQFGPFQNTIHCEATADDAFSGHSDPHIVQGSCGTYIGRPEENTVCLGNRFLVEIVDVTNSTTGIGVPVRIGSNDTTLYWFYSDTNFEVMLKVLNGCGLNAHYWVFGGALTNQGYRIVVTDTLASGHPQKQYINTLGTRAAAIADTNAFATCF